MIAVTLGTLVGVSVHPSASTPIQYRINEPGRVVIRVGEAGGDPCGVNLFLDRADLVRLRDTMNAALAVMDTAAGQAAGEPVEDRES